MPSGENVRLAIAPTRGGDSPWLACPPHPTVVAEHNTEHGSGLGRFRRVVERTFAWLNQFRRLRVRYEKRADIHEAFLSLGCARICWRFLNASRNRDLRSR